MKQIALLLVLVVLVGSFTGCSKVPLPQIKTEYVYLDKPMPKIPKKPIPTKYNPILVNFNGVDYFAVERTEGAIMITNWESYRIWSETLHSILIKYADDNKSN